MAADLRPPPGHHLVQLSGAGQVARRESRDGILDLLGAVVVVFLPAFCFAQRALAAAASLARVAADIRRRPPRVAAPGVEVPRIEERRFSKASICRRIEMASCKALADVSMCGHIAGVN